MKTSSPLLLFLAAFAAPIVLGVETTATVTPATPAADAVAFTRPRLAAGTIFEERDGIVAVEAEDFSSQTRTDKRAFYIVTAERAPAVTPDPDAPHVEGASGGAYVEILPDTRATAADPLLAGTNFTNAPGVMATLHYAVYFNTPGRYHVWCRVFSTGGEDNGIHVGLDGTWPASGRRWQTTQKNAWSWDSRQRTEENHLGEPFLLYLDIPTAGLHEIAFSMREDGFELDKWVLAKDRDFKPTDAGPAPVVRQTSAAPAP